MPAFELHRDGYPAKAASAINANQVVTSDVGDTQRQVLPVSSHNLEPLGIALASAPNPGDAVTVMERRNVVKVTAGASLGAGTDIGVGSTNGTLAPIVGTQGLTRWRVGKSQTAAAAGEVFSLYVDPRQLSGNLA
jgi:hypothetical protein